MDGGRVLFDKASTINAVALARIQKGKGKPGDILFSSKGTVGKLARVPLDAPPFVCSPQTTYWRVLDLETLDRDFLYAFMRSRLFSDQYDAVKGETDMADYASLTAQRQFRVPLPPIALQRRIASVIRPLDDKIELNRRMNRTLEELAAALFRSWFLDFDPVVAKAAGRAPFGLAPEVAALFPSAFTDSELGPIPQGWRVGAIGDIADNPRRQITPSEVAPEMPYIGLEHMPRKSICLMEAGTAADVSSGKSRFASGEILFGKLRPYFHKVGIALCDGVCSTDVLVVTPRDELWFGVLLGHLSSEEFIDYTDASSGGTRMPRTSWHDMKLYKIALPPESLAQKLTEHYRRVAAVFAHHHRESRTLAALRDTLLPKLLSGELRVGAGSASREAGS